MVALWNRADHYIFALWFLLSIFMAALCNRAGHIYFHPVVCFSSFMFFLANVNSGSRSLYAIARPSVVCLSSVCLSSVTFVRPTQAVQIFGNISTVFGTLAIR